MKIFNILKSFFTNENNNGQAIFRLKDTLSKHPVLRHQIEEIDDILSSFVTKKQERKQNFGLTIQAPQGVGKTFFIIEFLMDYLYALGIIKSKKVFKLSTYQFVQQSNPYQFIGKVKDYQDTIEKLLHDSIKDGIVMVEELRINDMHVFKNIILSIENIMKNPKYINTVFVLCLSSKDKKYLSKEWEYTRSFPPEFELSFPIPNATQLAELFIEYAHIRGYHVNTETIPTLKYFFKVRKNISHVSNTLIYQKKIDRKRRIPFIYAMELQTLFNSIILNETKNISKWDIHNSQLFIETKKIEEEFKKLKE